MLIILWQCWNTGCTSHTVNSLTLVQFTISLPKGAHSSVEPVPAAVWQDSGDHVSSADVHPTAVDWAQQDDVQCTLGRPSVQPNTEPLRNQTSTPQQTCPSPTAPKFHDYSAYNLTISSYWTEHWSYFRFKNWQMWWFHSIVLSKIAKHCLHNIPQSSSVHSTKVKVIWKCTAHHPELI